MSLARDIDELHSILVAKGIDPFAPVNTSGLFDQPEVLSLLDRMQGRDSHESRKVLRTCLQALRVQSAEIRRRFVEAEFVATLPIGTPGLARSTAAVVAEMISSAKDEVILIGYDLTDEPTFELLASASGRGVDVIVICDRNREGATRVLSSWPAGVKEPRIFVDCEREDAAKFAKLHAKSLLIDANDLLITSANFTFHGLHGNIEIGTRLKGASANEARKIFLHLLSSKLVEPFNSR